MTLLLDCDFTFGETETLTVLVVSQLLRAQQLHIGFLCYLDCVYPKQWWCARDIYITNRTMYMSSLPCAFHQENFTHDLFFYPAHMCKGWISFITVFVIMSTRIAKSRSEWQVAQWIWRKTGFSMALNHLARPTSVTKFNSLCLLATAAMSIDHSYCTSADVHNWPSKINEGRGHQ